MRHVIAPLSLTLLLVGCRSEDTVAELADLRARNEALASRVETLEHEAKERAERLQALEHAVEELEKAPPPPVIDVSRGLSDEHHERMNEIGIRMLEQMQEDGSLDRAGQLGLDALQQLLESERNDRAAAQGDEGTKADEAE